MSAVLPVGDPSVPGDTGAEGLVAEGLIRYYGKWQVVKGVSLQVRRGEVVGLLGPNGAARAPRST